MSLLNPWVRNLFIFGAMICAGSSVFAEVSFRRHVLNKQSEFSACAVFDVDHDGKLDVVSGGFWYQGPTWQRHKVRDVENIRGRYDDYSSLTLDVNADGWMDLISVNYRSKSLYWVQHPGRSLGSWKKHLIDTPGPSETGRLYDVDGDGRLDVLPNGTNFAAWYELLQTKNRDGTTVPVWIKHDLPRQAIGHGLGMGDIDGDGRLDIVSPKGWLKAPSNARTGRWMWHDEFQLHRDGSIPILVYDVDRDGDNDIVWGRGHNIGLYWLQQISNGGQRQWVRHAIDTSWSSAHSIMKADIDGDGIDDLVAGKRYLGHDGRDPGETDPLAIYWYRFDPSTLTWRRGLVSWGADCGFDLDPKCVDIDGDGDVDILAAARSGLFLLENLRISAATRAGDINAGEIVPDYQDHHQLMFYKTIDGERRPVKMAFDWGIRRSHILRNMEKVMGPLPGPERRVPLDVRVHSEERTEDYIRRKITYVAESGDRVPAYLLIPNNHSQPVPALLCLHPTSPLGKDQVCGLGGKPSRHYAHELARRGYICLAPDYPSFGDYQFEFGKIERGYVSGTMKAIWNNIRAIDLLESMPEVRPDHIGCNGHSLGGHNGLFTAAFDQRIRVVVTSCGFNAFEDYYDGNLAGWSSDRYMPRIASRFGNDPGRMPFDFHEVIASLAPRPVFVNAPLRDANFPVQGVRKVISSVEEVYRFQNASDELTVVYPDSAHDFPDGIRDQVYCWLDAKFALGTLNSEMRQFPGFK